MPQWRMSQEEMAAVGNAIALTIHDACPGPGEGIKILMSVLASIFASHRRPGEEAMAVEEFVADFRGHVEVAIGAMRDCRRGQC